jgi:hypothetical protein
MAGYVWRIAFSFLFQEDSNACASLEKVLSSGAKKFVLWFFIGKFDTKDMLVGTSDRDIIVGDEAQITFFGYSISSVQSVLYNPGGNDRILKKIKKEGEKKEKRT